MVTNQPGLSDEVLGYHIAQLVLQSDLQARHPALHLLFSDIILDV